MLDRKRNVKVVVNVVGKHPIERFVQIWVNSLNIVQGDWLIQQHLVEWSGKAPIDMVAMEDGSAYYATHEVKVRQMVGIYTTVRIDLQSVNIISEKGNVR